MPRLRQNRGMKGGWVYIMTNAPYGTLYIGVTSNLAARVVQHRTGKGSRFCRKYGLTRLVYCEPYGSIDEAIAREKAVKAWQRRWKTRLTSTDPAWTPAFAGVTVWRLPTHSVMPAQAGIHGDRATPSPTPHGPQLSLG